jgi:iron complex outermembrane receptor protein
MLAAFLAGVLYTNAQIIRGRVSDAVTRMPLAGANISFGAKGGTTTDKDGYFSVDCGAVQKVSVSYLGYETAQQSVKNCQDEISVWLTPSSHYLNEVEITATSAQNKSILYQPASINKLNPTELKRGTGLFLDDAINTNIPGVTMQRRTVSAGQQFNIRGYGNGVRGTNGISSNFDVQGSKVYLNGIPLTDAEGITLLDDIDFASIGNVEVTKGPSGTLYGLAIAGVVNLKTLKPEAGKTSVGQDAIIGSYGLKRFTTRFEMGGERSSLLLNYGYQESDGFMSHTASTKRFVNIAGDFQVSDRQLLNTYFGYSHSYDERGGELTIAQYNNRDYTGNPEYIKRNAHSDVTSFRGGIGHTWRFNGHVSNTSSVFASGVSNNASSAGGWTDKDPINLGLRSTVNMQYGLKNNTGLSGITGIETQRQHAQTIGYNMVANPNDPNAYWIVGAMRSNQATVTGTTSLFTEWTLSLPHDLSLTAGVGVSNMKIELNDRFYVATNRNPTRFGRSYNGMVSPHVALNKVFNKQFSVYAAYSKGYKAPVSSYFFIPATGQLNTDLVPEKGNQFEIGSKGSLLNGRLSYQLAVFRALFSDKMTAVAVPLNGSTTTTAYSYVANGGEQDHKGVEALVKYTAYQSATGFFRTVRPFGNLAYSHFRYRDFKFQVLNPARTGIVETDYSGKAVGGVPPVTANLGVDVMTGPGLYANAVYSYRDKQPITSDGVNMTTSFNLLNAKLGFRRSLSGHFDLDAFFGVNNITGTQHYYMVFVNQLPDAYLPAPYKANYFGGVNLKYNF